MKILIKTIIRVAFIALFCAMCWKVMNDYTKAINWFWAYLYLVTTTVIVPAIIDFLLKDKKARDWDGSLEIVDAGEEGTTYLMHIDMNSNFEDKDELWIRVDK